jgi:hypothetical protein
MRRRLKRDSEMHYGAYDQNWCYDYYVHLLSRQWRELYPEQISTNQPIGGRCLGFDLPDDAHAVRIKRMKSHVTATPRLCLGVALLFAIGMTNRACGQDVNLEKITKLFNETAQIEVKGLITSTSSPTPDVEAEQIAEREKEKFIKKSEANSGVDYNPFLIQQQAERLKQTLLKMLKDGSPKVFKLDFVQTPQALYLKYFNVNDPNFVVTEYYTRGTLYHIDSNSQTISISKTDTISSYYIGVISGVWSHPGRYSAALASSPEIKMSDTPDKKGLIFSRTINGCLLSDTLSKDSLFLTQSQGVNPGIGASEKFIYKDFVASDGIMIPRTITYENHNKLETLKRVITIDEVNFEPKVDLTPENFGFLQAIDGRFNPPLNYFVRDTLPSNDVLIDLAADPKKLMEYNMHMHGNSGNDSTPDSTPVNNN